MKIYIETAAVKSAGSAIAVKVSEMTASVERQVISRGTRAVNEMRNAELEVLSGSRGGRIYRKYPFKSTYTASAPGEAPARRTGDLRLHWTGSVKGGASGGGASIVATLESNTHYAGYLEYGTSKMARRPFVDKITEKALPKVKAIFNEPYF